ncbi:hypothetical protein H8B02_39925 [Bradyrhizobium sp. Pear77]|uniref:hypothetical protein n=1 Tax=Bradyrhizobium altum TaxID=1571202 RepID=UPI001E58EA9C|nr:hypothetical protein [Bradyrhizobium altum]MCC8959357.1 hypothetical protein [Bradyrhizobium altum]
MPLSTVEIPLSTNAPYYSGAQFLSVVAYPDPMDGQRRLQFSHALAIWALRMRTALEPEWAKSPQPILPWLFAVELGSIEKVRVDGVRNLYRRVVCGRQILLPAIADAHQQTEPTVDGFAPTLQNILLSSVLPLLNLSDESRATFKSRTWGPSRPVAPAALAFWMWLQDRVPKGEAITERALIEFFFSIDSLCEVLEITRVLRILANSVKRFEVRKSHTIRFVGISAVDQTQRIPETI